MADLKVWCLFIDHEKKATFGHAFDVNLPFLASVSDLKEKVEEKKTDILAAPGMLTVWRCIDPQLRKRMDMVELEAKLTDVNLSVETKAKRLAVGQEIATLGLDDGEILLIEVPATPAKQPRFPSDFTKARDGLNEDTIVSANRSSKRVRISDGSDTVLHREPKSRHPLSELWDSSWGIRLPERFTKLSESHSVEDGDLLVVNPSESRFIDVYTPMKPEKFLVRAEYIRVYDFVEETFLSKEHRQTPAVIVTGQPGIGKTVWISYALRRRLSEKRPTLLYTLGKTHLFSEAGVETVRDDAGSAIFFRGASGEMPWCFIDSADSPEGIPRTVIGVMAKGVLPIYVSSPKSERWKNLHQIRKPCITVMNPWTWEEIEHTTSELYPEDQALVRRRFDELGPTPRLCFG